MNPYTPLVRLSRLKLTSVENLFKKIQRVFFLKVIIRLGWSHFIQVIRQIFLKNCMNYENKNIFIKESTGGKDSAPKQSPVAGDFMFFARMNSS